MLAHFMENADHVSPNSVNYVVFNGQWLKCQSEMAMYCHLSRRMAMSESDPCILFEH